MMNCTPYLTVAVFFSLALAVIPYAAAGEGPGVAVKAGTLGVGAELSMPLMPNTRLRGGISYLNYNFDATLQTKVDSGIDKKADVEQTDITYDFDPEIKTLSLLLDVHPFGGSFFLTGGVYFNQTEVGVTGTVSPDDVPPQYADYSFLAELVSVKADVEFNPIAPYAGIGWRSNSDESGWGVALELGVMYLGEPDVKNLRVQAPRDVNAYREVQVFIPEQEAEIEDEISWFKYYPVASVMVTYHF